MVAHRHYERKVDSFGSQFGTWIDQPHQAVQVHATSISSQQQAGRGLSFLQFSVSTAFTHCA
eukprot:4830740-Prorocentrum_lima.AAC.1